jgi:hemin uptake protein HemP
MSADPSFPDAAGSPFRPTSRPSCESPGRAIPSSMLLGDRDAVTIEHRGSFYVLRATRAGKLILTK